MLQHPADKDKESERPSSSHTGLRMPATLLAGNRAAPSEKATRTNIAENEDERSSRVSVFIADASRMNCQTMAAALRRGRYKFTVVGYAMDTKALLGALGNTKVDVALVSARLQEGPTAGISAARAIRTLSPHTNIVMMLDLLNRSTIIEAFRSGARGILSREDPLDVLCRCIRSVHRGQVWAKSQELRFALDALATPELHPSSVAREMKGPSGLTKREETVVQLVVQGHTNREISRKLSLSENTVRNYLFRIFNKVGASTRLELAIYAMSRWKDANSPDAELPIPE